MPYAPSLVEVPESLGTTLKPLSLPTQQPRISVLCHFPFMLSPPLCSLMKCPTQPRQLQISANIQMRRIMARVTRAKGQAIGMTLCCTKTTSPFSLYLLSGNAREPATTYKNKRTSERLCLRQHGNARKMRGARRSKEGQACTEQRHPHERPKREKAE
jgi:hypothetical protein